ncbi:MAG: glycosyltransferase family 39 protein [Candidatus Hydrogenedentes bacterium]|nr:glycosyltransferase family 39 protein [Candidatus Hydrogenedentota bacterium]
MNEDSAIPRLRQGDVLIIGAFALAKLAIHLVTLTGYGWFRDELYYIECARHLDWGYVDHPPLSILLLAPVRLIFGDALWAVRLAAAVTGSVFVILGGILARWLGGDRFAIALACLAYVVAPIYLGLSNYYSMNVLDLLFWTAGALVLVRLIQTGDSRLWLLYGFLAGLGLQNKMSMAFFGGGLVIAMALTPQRVWFKDKLLYAGGLIAFLIYLPNILWQIAYGFPTLEFMANAALYKNNPMTPLKLLLESILLIHPLGLLLWVPGLVLAFRSERLRPYRLFAWIWIFVFILFSLTNGKAYYLAAAFPPLIALGAIAWEGWLQRAWHRTAVLAVLALGGLVMLPYAVPLLPVETFLRYQEALGISAPQMERGHTAALPQHFGDRFGWPEMVNTITAQYEALSPEEQAHCAIFTSNYGEAGAVNILGANLPRAVSGHNNYYFWGPPDEDITVLLTLGVDDTGGLSNLFEEIEQVGEFRHPYAMPYEQGPIYRCRKPKVDLRDAWPKVKGFG